MKRLSLVAVLPIAALWPAAAGAHLVNTGLGPLYDGISHLLLSPDDLLPVVTMALLAGLNGAAAGRRALFVLPAAWVIGGALGAILGRPVVPDGVAAGSFLVLGALTAADRRMPSSLVGAIAGMLGLLLGWRNGAALLATQVHGLALVGIGAAIFVVVAMAAALAVSARAAWARVAMRVAGSWVAATGLLMLGWSLRGM